MGSLTDDEVADRVLTGFRSSFTEDDLASLLHRLRQARQ
jgi:hypothetical protein